MTVELFGIARALAAAPRIEIGGDRLTPRELVRGLAAACPAMIGSVVDVATERFIAPNLLLLDGTRAPDEDVAFGAGDRPCVLFLASGG